MTIEDAKKLSSHMDRIAATINNSHAEAADLRHVAIALAEVLDHIAAELEAKSRKPKK